MDRKFIKQYKKNIKYLQKHHPKLYEKFLFSGYDDKWDVQIVEDERGLNLFMDGKRLYDIDIQGESKKFSQQFADKLNYIKHNVSVSMEDNKRWKDSLYDNFINSLKPTQQIDSTQEDKNIIPLLIVYGVGFGYHLLEIVQKMQVRNIILAEADIELIKPSLYTLDWEELLDMVNVDIAVGRDAKTLAENIAQCIANFSQVYMVYYHTFYLYSSSLFEDAYKELKVITELSRNNWGFWDDELLALQHTFANIKKALPFFVEPFKMIDESVPVCIVASGPSLDKDIDTLKKLKDKVLIFSCGTALKPLLEYGIYPDFEFIFERTEGPYDALLKTINKEQLLKLPLIAPNVVYPPIFEGENKYMVLRGSDSGTHLFDEQYDCLLNTGPTVTNFTFAFALAAGFKEIYLFGVDLGFKDKNYHHSKASIYHTDERYKIKMEIYREVEGNFGGKIYTNQLLYDTKEALERNISLYKDVNVYNVSDGAKIEGSKRVASKDIKIENALDKESALEKLLQSFDQEFFKDIEKYQRKYQENIQGFEEFCQLFQKKSFVTLDEFFDFIEKDLDKALKKLHREYRSTWALVRGTLYTGLAAAILYMFEFYSDQAKLEYLNRQVFYQIDIFLQKLYKELKKIESDPIIRM